MHVLKRSLYILMTPWEEGVGVAFEEGWVRFDAAFNVGVGDEKDVRESMRVVLEATKLFAAA